MQEKQPYFLKISHLKSVSNTMLYRRHLLQLPQFSIDLVLTNDTKSPRQPGNWTHTGQLHLRTLDSRQCSIQARGSAAAGAAYQGVVFRVQCKQRGLKQRLGFKDSTEEEAKQRMSSQSLQAKSSRIAHMEPECRAPREPADIPEKSFLNNKAKLEKD